MIMKKLFRIFAFVAISAFIFTSCETEDAVITLVGDAVIAFDLGEEFVDPGVTVENGKVDDVTVTFSPQYDKFKVDEYVATYTLGNASAQRTVWVRSNDLAGTYSVSDAIDGVGTLTYEVTVAQKAAEYNVLRITGFNDFNIVVEATINGNVITIPSQTPSNWNAAAGELVMGSGTYNGETEALVNFTYTIKWLDGGELVTDTGTATYTRVVK
jgi:hypothetical protein